MGILHQQQTETALYTAIETLLLQSTFQMMELLDFVRFLPPERKKYLNQNLSHLKKSIHDAFLNE